MNLKYYILDYFDWSIDAKYLPFLPNDTEMRELNRVGMASSFTLQGLYEKTIKWEKGLGMWEMLITMPPNN